MPDQGPYSAKIVFSMAVPFVAVSMALRIPSKPLVGILYVILHTVFQCEIQFEAEGKQRHQLQSELQCEEGTKQKQQSGQKHCLEAAEQYWAQAAMAT